MKLRALAVLLLAAPVAARYSPEVTEETFDAVHGLIKPQLGEVLFLEIPWVINVTEARKKAAEEGKPLLVWGLNNGHSLGKS